MKRNKFVITIVLIALLSAMFGAGGAKPALAEATTLANEAGMTAWYKNGVTITPNAFISSFSIIEYQTPDYIIGTVDIPIYVDEYNPHVLVHKDGYIVAFYPNTDPAAKMVDVIAKTLNTTLLEYAVVMVGAAGGVTVGDVSYYDFSDPAATNMLVLAETKADGENAFSLTMPSTDYTYYDKSYGFYQTYLPEFTLNEVNFVEDNADFIAPGYYGSIFGHFYADPDSEVDPVITDLVPNVLNAFNVNSGSTSAFGAVVVSYSYTTAGTFIVSDADFRLDLALSIPGTMGLTTVEYLPGAITKTAPTDEATGQLLNPKLDWSDSTSPNYEYCIDQTAPGTVTTETDNCGTGWVSTPPDVSEVTLSGLLFNTTYYWQVRAWNSSGTVYADEGTWWSFTTEAFTYPEAFSKLSPTTGTEDLSPNGLVLEWEDTYGAYFYEYCISTSPSSCTTWINVGTDNSVVAPGLVFGTTYYWQVRAGNDVHNTLANDGDMWSFTTLDTFSKLLPANRAINQKTRLTLTWEKLGASTYQYCIDKTAPGTVPAEIEDCGTSWISTGSATKVTLRLDYATLYYWQVRASNGTTIIYANDDNEPLTSDWWSFTTAAKNTPSSNVQFEKISPQDGATDVFTAVTLKWVTVSATKYEYCIDDVEVTNETCTWTAVGTATSATITGLAQGTTYYWQVRATINDVLTYADKGAFWDFTTTYTKSTPDDHSLDQPINDLKLSWQTVTGAVDYQYCLSLVESCMTYASTGTATDITLNNLSYGTRYYWQVRANIGTTLVPVWLYANGSSTALWRFTTEALEKISPQNGAIDQPINITLDWSEVDGAIAYEYCLSTDGTCAVWVSTADVSTADVTKLSYSTKYYWQVRANVGTVDVADWLYADGGTYWSFTTENLEKISPVDGAVNQPIDLTLDWGDVSAAIEYEYCLSATASCTSWDSAGNTSFIKLTGLTYTTSYYWQARANIGTETAPIWLYADGLETAFWYFTTIDEPVDEPLP